MHIKASPIAAVLVITPARFADNRGFFCESWNRAGLKGAGVDIDFVQDNHSFSPLAGTVRGLHYQSPPHAQAKLVRCGRGRLQDVAVDIRKGSPTFGKWVSEELSFENGKQLYIPVGFLHGFVTLEPDTEIVYKCSDYYFPEYEGTIRYNDPDIFIEWDIINSIVILSDKDKAAPRLSDITSPFEYMG